MINVASVIKDPINVSLGAKFSLDFGISNWLKLAKGSKLVNAPKILKHYIQKQTSFNNV